MSVTNETYRVQVTLATAVQAIPVTFYFLEQDDLIVYQTVAGVDTLMVLNTNYTLTGEGVEAGGALTTIGGTVGAVWTVARADALTQSEEFLYSGSLAPAAVERGYDRLAMQIQRIYSMAARSLRLPVTNAEGGELALNDRKGQLLGFNATTGAPEYTLKQDIIDDAAAAALASEVAAQAAQAAAEVAQVAAELAETNAETAEANAELAEANAEQAVVDAGIQVVLATDQVALAALQVGLAADQVALAVAQVGLATDQAEEATLQAGIAGDEADAAALSAIAAANTMAANFLGGIAGASVPATAPLAGNYYAITIGGTSQGKTWVLGDQAIYNGSSGSWTQITGYYLGATPLIQSALIGYLPDGYPNSDGATANRAAGIYGPFDAVNNPREYVAGAATYTVAGIVTIPSTTPSAYIGILNVQATTTANVDNRGMRVYLGNTNELVVDAQGAAWAADRRSFTNATFRTTYSGQTIFLKITLTQGTATNPIVEVNGVNISASFTLATTGTPPAWLDAAMVPTYRLVGYNWPSGPAPIVTPIMGQTSAADDAFYMQTGKWPAWVVAGGSAGNEILNASRNSNFSALATDFTAGSNCIVSAATGALIMTSIASVGNQFAQLATGFLRSGALRFGNSFRVVGNVSANTTGGAIRISDSSGNQAFQLTASTGAFDVIITPTSSFWAGGFIVSSAVQPASVVSFTLASISFYPLGAISLPSVQPINVIDDVSGIGGNQGRLLGCTAVTSRTDWTIRQDVVHAGADNKRILEGELIDDTRDVIDFIEQRPSTGTPTTLLGSVSAGAQYKASSALAAGINPVTLVTRKAATKEFWSQASTACLLRNTITGHRSN